MRISKTGWTFALLLLNGCASQGTYLGEGTVLLGQVSHTLTMS